MFETINPIWEEVETIRARTISYLAESGISTKSAQAVEMVTGELVENAIKYGVFDVGHQKIEIRLERERDMIVLEVANHVDDSRTADLQELDRIIQWIRGFQDPFEAYVERLQTVSQKSLLDEESGLGIVRVAYEARAILDFFVSEDDLLTVAAVVHIDE